ncbi:MAG TPA: hypothetical protein PLV27_07725 [Anaerolineaceae bacterium]|nr:hypothetical protein [Anaerolineaceae bacterium]
MADIRCLVCDRLNDESAERCWFCHSMLPKATGPLTRHEREKLANFYKKQPLVKNPSPAAEPEKTDENTVPQTPSNEDIPDWLARIRKLKEEDQKSSIPEEPLPPEPQTDKPTSVTEEPEKPPSVETGIPDWLYNLRETAANTPAEPSEPTHSKKPAIDESLAFRGSLRDDEYQPLGEEEVAALLNPLILQPSEAPPVENVSADHMEDQSQPEPPEHITVSNPPHEEDLIPSIPQLEEIPPIELEEPLAIERGESPEFASSPPIKEDLPPFPSFLEELPDWLSKESPLIEEAEKSTESEASQAEKELEKAALPSWLSPHHKEEGTAPVPPAAGAEEFTEEGVLAGISGTLPGIEIKDRALKIHPFMPDASVSAMQQQNAQLFQQLLQPAGTRLLAEKAAKPHHRGEKILRLVITLLLLLGVIYPFFAGSFTGVFPVLYPAEVVASLGVIQNLPAEKPVLIAAHFEAALAGELNWTAQSVLDHLVSRGVPIAITSTNVTGYAMVNQFVEQAAARQPTYALEEKVFNLGYLPGGTIGMGAIVNHPLAALPLTTNLQPVTDLPILNAIHSLSDYGSVILVTDSPEIARTWIEQINQLDAPVSVIAVVSAQAAPLLQPYFDSGQISGYVSGLNGALSYELLRLVPGQAFQRFSSYQIALLLTAVILFIGGMIYFILGSVTPSAKGGG